MFGKKAKKDRQLQKDRFKKMFHLQLKEFTEMAIDEKKKLREVYWEHHWMLKSRQATNIITADRVGRGEQTRQVEIKGIVKRDETAEEIFREALDEFIDEVGEIRIHQELHEVKTTELNLNEITEVDGDAPDSTPDAKPDDTENAGPDELHNEPATKGEEDNG